MDPKQPIAEAIHVLKDLGLPRAQLNERTALCLLALLDVHPGRKWSDAESPLIGITPIMTWARDHYGADYAPNTRETFRRQSMHQFIDAGICLYNPDNPLRPVNSPAAVYQIEPAALLLLKSVGTEDYKVLLPTYLAAKGTLVQQYAKEREMNMVPVKVGDGEELKLSPGEHSELIKSIIEAFAPRYAPGSIVVYLGDTGDKHGRFDKRLLELLGVTLDGHGKLPDVVLYMRDKNWLLLIESVTSHGPVDSKRHAELATLFKKSNASLVYVSAFPDRKTFLAFAAVISWETEVWIADAPTHLIHFNGERFLGPYEG